MVSLKAFIPTRSNTICLYGFVSYKYLIIFFIITCIICKFCLLMVMDIPQVGSACHICLFFYVLFQLWMHFGMIMLVHFKVGGGEVELTDFLF